MNWADMSSVVIVLATAFSGTAAAHSKGAPWWLLLLSIVLSLAIGLGTAMLSRRLAYAILAKEPKGLNAGVALLLYLIIPLAFVYASAALAIVGMEWLTGLFT